MSRRGKGPDDRTPADLQAALERLERAVRQFASTAKGEFASRAASFIDEAATKLEREFRVGGRSASRRSGSHQSDSRRSNTRRSARGTGGQRTRHRPRGRSRSSRTGNEWGRGTRKLCRDPENAKIAGVCAGVAHYLGAQVWVVRCVAVTGLIFMPSIVFPAYWILYFVLGPSVKEERGAADSASRDPQDHTSPAPELGPRLSPRRSLRNVRADLAQTELRLRRMESHVTSGQYELQKELNKLDGDGAATRDR